MSKTNESVKLRWSSLSAGLAYMGSFIVIMIASALLGMSKSPVGDSEIPFTTVLFVVGTGLLILGLIADVNSYSRGEYKMSDPDQV